jgi:hypothetical protein
MRAQLYVGWNRTPMGLARTRCSDFCCARDSWGVRALRHGEDDVPDRGTLPSGEGDMGARDSRA